MTTKPSTASTGSASAPNTRTNTSYLDQVVPTADEFITSNPTINSYLAYLGDTWSIGDRLQVSGTARATHAHYKSFTGFAYDVGSIDPHLGASYRLGSEYALRANFDHINVAPAPLEADRVDSTNVDAQEALTIAQRYVNGEISLDKMAAAIMALSTDGSSV